MSKPTRTFTANEGQPSVGTAGPDQIEYDLDNLFAMFNPQALLRDGSSGGIGQENIRPGAATDAIIGARTINDLQQLAADTALLSVLLSALANRIKQIKGTATWRDNAALTIAQIAQTVTPTGLAAGKATDAVIGPRTINQAQLPTSDTGTLSELLGRIANRIQAILGTGNWKDAPPTSLAAVLAHMNNGTIHQAGHIHNGISNPGGDIPIVAGTGIAVTADPVSKTIQIDATGGTAPGPHKETHYKTGSDPIRPSDIGALSKDSDDSTSGDLTLGKRVLGAALAAIFAGAQTAKSALKWLQAAGSSAAAAILHESSATAGYTSKGVLHLMPAAVNSNADAYVSIHGQDQAETLRLYTGGDIATPGTVRAGGAVISGVLDVSAGFAVAPVGADKWAT